MNEGTTLAIALTAAVSVITTLAIISHVAAKKTIQRHEERLQILERQGATDQEWKKNMDSKMTKVIETLDVISKVLVK